MHLPVPANQHTQDDGGSSPQFLDEAFRKLLAEVVVGAPERYGDDLKVSALSTKAVGEMQAVKDSLEKTLSLAATWAAKHPALAASFASRHSLRGLAFPFDASPTMTPDTAFLHPTSPNVMSVYRKVFFEKIDPLIKVLHRPTVEILLSKTLEDPASLLPSELSVVFSIYLASLCSMSSTEASACCGGMSKHTALATYKGAVEHALVRAKLGHTDDLTALQGFVLYLGLNRFFAERSLDSTNATDQSRANNHHKTWALIGFAYRLFASTTALSDSAHKSPFEQEMGKRLHLALWYLEHRAREDLGRGVVSESPWDSAAAAELSIFPFASLPANARDADLHPGMTLPPAPHCGWTEISFSLMQMEIATTTRTVRSTDSNGMLLTLVHKVAMIDSCEGRIREEYLRYCDGSSVVHWLANHVAYVLIMELRFQVYGQSPPPPMVAGGPAANELLLTGAMDMLDAEKRMRDKEDQEESQAVQWGWLLMEFLQFWPLMFLLQHLSSSSRPVPIPLGDRAWRVAERSFRRWERTGNNNGVGSSLYIEALRELWMQAQAARVFAASDISMFFCPDGFTGGMTQQGGGGGGGIGSTEDVNDWVDLEGSSYMHWELDQGPWYLGNI